MRLGHDAPRPRASGSRRRRRASRRCWATGADCSTHYVDRFDDAYWIAEPEDIIALNLVQYGPEPRGQADNLSIHCEVYPARGATLVTVIAADHPGLFYRIAGGIHLAGGNIIDARIHTTRSGWAVDNFLVQDPLGRPFSEASTDRAASRSPSPTRWPTAIALVPAAGQAPAAAQPRAERSTSSRW